MNYEIVYLNSFFNPFEMKINYSVLLQNLNIVSISLIINFNKICDVKLLKPILTFFLKNHLFTTYFGLQNF